MRNGLVPDPQLARCRYERRWNRRPRRFETGETPVPPKCLSRGEFQGPSSGVGGSEIAAFCLASGHRLWDNAERTILSGRKPVPIVFACHCGREVAADERAGQYTRCQYCGRVLALPSRPRPAQAALSMPRSPAGITIDFPCPGCGTTLQVKDAWGGKKGSCPSCGGVVEFPAFLPPVRWTPGREFAPSPASALVHPPAPVVPQPPSEIRAGHFDREYSGFVPSPRSHFRRKHSKPRRRELLLAVGMSVSGVALLVILILLIAFSPEEKKAPWRSPPGPTSPDLRPPARRRRGSSRITPAPVSRMICGPCVSRAGRLPRRRGWFRLCRRT